VQLTTRTMTQIDFLKCLVAPRSCRARKPPIRVVSKK
jgi:hypothetical protein